jgi:hypothetical protein
MHNQSSNLCLYYLWFIGAGRAGGEAGAVLRSQNNFLSHSIDFLLLFCAATKAKKGINWPRKRNSGQLFGRHNDYGGPIKILKTSNNDLNWELDTPESSLFQVTTQRRAWGKSIKFYNAARKAEGA